MAELLVRDGADNRPPTTLEGALHAVDRYRGFLDFLDRPHDETTCTVCAKAPAWPGEFFFHVGKPTVICAPQGAGKTNTVSYLLELLLGHRRDVDVYTCIPYPWFEDLAGVVPGPAHLFPVHDALELFEGMARTLKAGRVPAAALDESGQWFSSHNWRSDAAESATKFTYVERHYRLRGPIFVYHTWKTVLEPFRQAGDLRGSYCVIVRKQGRYRLARQEDTSRWWVVDQTALPYLNLGLRGFEWNLDFQELGARLHGSLTQIADQTLEYVAEVRENRELERETAMAEARLSREEALAKRELGVAELHRAHEERREAIVQAFMADPGLTNRAAQRRFRASPGYLVDCRRVALARLQARGRPLPVTQEAP